MFVLFQFREGGNGVPGVATDALKREARGKTKISIIALEHFNKRGNGFLWLGIQVLQDCCNHFVDRSVLISE